MNSRAKGSAFERLVAEMVRKAYGVSKQDCYRTPLSGGHPYGDRGDLVVSDALFRLFPYVVECKHRRTWHPGVMFDMRAEERAWVGQVVRACAASSRKASPLLVMRGNGTPVYAYYPYAAMPSVAGLGDYALFGCPEPWVLCRFEWFLANSLKTKRK